MAMAVAKEQKCFLVELYTLNRNKNENSQCLFWKPYNWKKLNVSKWICEHQLKQFLWSFEICSYQFHRVWFHSKVKKKETRNKQSVGRILELLPYKIHNYHEILQRVFTICNNIGKV